MVDAIVACDFSFVRGTRLAALRMTNGGTIFSICYRRAARYLKLAAATLEGRTMERLWIGNIALGTTDDGLPERNSIQRTAGTDHEQQLRPPFESAQQAGMSRMTDDRTVAESNQSGSAAL